MEQQEMSDSDMVEQVANVLEVIRRPALRRQFLTHPEQTLRDNGVDLDVFPTEMVDVLADMSYDELGVVAHLHEQSIRHNVEIGRSVDRGIRLHFV